MVSEDFQKQAMVFKALGHPTRLLIVHALSERERTVGEIQEIVGASLPTGSRHLQILREAGVIQGTKVGSSIICTLSTPCLVNVLTCLGDVRSGCCHQSPKQ